MKLWVSRELVNSPESSNYKKNEAMTNSSMKDLNDYGCLDTIYREFDPGSGRTLAACLTHASRTELSSLLLNLVANG